MEKASEDDQQIEKEEKIFLEEQRSSSKNSKGTLSQGSQVFGSHSHKNSSEEEKKGEDSLPENIHCIDSLIGKKIDNVLDQLISEEDASSLVEAPEMIAQPTQDESEMYEYGEEDPNIYETEEEQERERQRI